MASPYLATKTTALASQSPVAPALARAAQIPLQSFSLPVFPPEAFSSGLESLILTSDVKLDEYAALLTQPFSVPDLPKSITSLTLELFSLGYPPGFLGELGRKLGALKALTLYSQLFAGTTQDSRDDAINFIKTQTELKEVHVLDVFGPGGVFTDLMSALSPDVKFLEINYTFRHSDPQFLASVPSKEILGGLEGRGALVGLTIGVSGPDVTDDEDDREGTEVGMRPVSGEGEAFVERIENLGEGLILLDATMFELSVGEVEKVLEVCKGVKILSVSVGLVNGWGEVLNVVGKEGKGAAVEQLEIVGVPGEELVERLKGSGELVVEKGELDALGVRCKGLKTLKVSILRTRMEFWYKVGEEWVKKT